MLRHLFLCGPVTLGPRQYWLLLHAWNWLIRIGHNVRITPPNPRGSDNTDTLWYLDDWCLSPVWLPAFIIRIKHQGIMSPVWLSAWPIPTWNPSLQPRCRHCPRSSLSPSRSQWYVYLRAKKKLFFSNCAFFWPQFWSWQFWWETEINSWICT